MLSTKTANPIEELLAFGEKFILVDIDHTISDAFWRDDMIGTVPWDEYHALSAMDAPLHDICDIILRLRDQFVLVGLTARPDKWRKLTNEWCVRNRIELDYILMRSDDDYRPAPKLKVDLIKESFEDLSRIICVFEDRDDVVAALRAEGLSVLQVHGKRGVSPT